MLRRSTIAKSTGALALLLVCSSAAAAKKDAAGLSADEHAMNDLFAAAKYGEAQAAIEEAIAACRRCSKKVKARLHADLGVVFVTGLNDTEAGQAEMVKARKLDPSVELDPAFASPEAQAAFDAAASLAGEADEETEEPPEVSDETAEAAPKHKKGKQAEGDLAVRACNSNADCGETSVCADGWCRASTEEDREKAHRGGSSPGFWLSLGLVQDFMLTSGSDVCTQQSQVSGGFTCVRSSGSQYHGTPLAGSAGNLGGFALAATRVTLAANVRLSDALSAGVRLGYAFLGQGPTPDGGHDFLSFSAEAQGAYWFSRRPFATEVVGTFLELSAGIAEVDGKGTVTVHENQQVKPPASQLNNPATQSLDVYQKSGAGFAGAGFGLFLPFGGASGLLADLRVIQLFPTSGTAISFGVSGALGL